MSDDRYGGDVLADFRLQRGPVRVPELAIEPGLVVEETATGFVGAVVRYANGLIELGRAVLSFASPLIAGWAVARGVGFAGLAVCAVVAIAWQRLSFLTTNGCLPRRCWIKLTDKNLWPYSFLLLQR